jgi:hypothetical protein
LGRRAARTLGRSFGQLTDTGVFRYSPVIGLLMSVFHAVPFWQFLYVSTILQVLALVWIARRWSLAACAWIGIPTAIFQGNIDLFIAVAVAVVVGMRDPAAWAFPLLTNATSGVGLLWLAVRREWRPLGFALATTASSRRRRSSCGRAYGPTGWACSRTTRSMALPMSRCRRQCDCRSPRR